MNGIYQQQASRQIIKFRQRDNIKKNTHTHTERNTEKKTSIKRPNKNKAKATTELNESKKELTKLSSVPKRSGVNNNNRKAHIQTGFVFQRRLCQQHSGKRAQAQREAEREIERKSKRATKRERVS